MSSTSVSNGQEHKLVANVIHLVSQPMTALQCSLEFALNTLADPEQCRTWIEAALENSERLRCRLSLAREVADAARFDDAGGTAELRSVLDEALSNSDPLFRDRGAAPRLRCDETEVFGERSRLVRAFLHLLQNLRPAVASGPDAPEVRVERKAESIEICFLRFVLQGNLKKDQVASQLEIAKETFESAGGGLIFFCFAGNDAFVRVFLRASQPQLHLYEDAGKRKAAAGIIGTTAVFPQVS